MSNTTPEAIEALKHADPVPGVHETILQRWSPRAFADRPVSASDLKKLFQAARWAASSFNEQPWRFLVGRKGDPTYTRIFESLVPLNQANYEIGAVTAMGYLGNVDVLPDSLKAAETTARNRKPLSEFVFSEWNKVAQLE